MANCNNHPSHLLPSAFHGSHSPSSGTGRSQDLSSTRFPCSLPERHISFVFDTLRFSVCIHIYSGSFTLPINLKTLTYSLLQPAPKSLVAHRVLRALWLYRCPTISFVFDTLRFILQFQVCSSFSPGSAPYIRVRLLYQSTSRLLHILFCSLPQNPWSPTVSFVLSGSIVVPPSLLYLIH